MKVFVVLWAVVSVCCGAVVPPIEEDNSMNLQEVPDLKKPTFVEMKDYFYYLSDGQTSSRRAFLSCQHLGGHIASVRNAEEQELLGKAVKELQVPFLIGLRRDRIHTTQFRWEDLTKFHFSNWYVGNPVTSDRQNCVVMRPDGTWESISCRTMQNFACRIPKSVCRHRPRRSFIFAGQYAMFFSHLEVDFKSAKNFCRMTQGQLLPITNIKELNFVGRFLVSPYHNPGMRMSRPPHRFFIGLSRDQTNTTNTPITEREFKWSAPGVDFTFGKEEAMRNDTTKKGFPWAAGEPDGKDWMKPDRPAGCVTVGNNWDDLRLWSDDDCERATRFICIYECVNKLKAKKYKKSKKTTPPPVTTTTVKPKIV